MQTSLPSKTQILMMINKEVDNDSLEWDELVEKIRIKFKKDKAPDINAVLFLIGIRELGMLKDKYTKEEKQDLMHIAVCRLLSEEGYYQLKGTDQDGWPHWELVKELPSMKLSKQENLLKEHIIRYFALEQIL